MVVPTFSSPSLVNTFIPIAFVLLSVLPLEIPAHEHLPWFLCRPPSLCPISLLMVATPEDMLVRWRNFPDPACLLQHMARNKDIDWVLREGGLGWVCLPRAPGQQDSHRAVRSLTLGLHVCLQSAAP